MVPRVEIEGRVVLEKTQLPRQTDDQALQKPKTLDPHKADTRIELHPYKTDDSDCEPRDVLIIQISANIKKLVTRFSVVQDGSEVDSG